LSFRARRTFALEKYSEEKSQAWVRHKTYQAWLAEFLQPVLAESFRTLRRSGHLVLNIADTATYPVATDALRIAREVFGPPTHTYRMAMSTNPADKARSGRLLREEPILVFRKR
jgi:hypothetical protein